MVGLVGFPSSKLNLYNWKGEFAVELLRLNLKLKLAHMANFCSSVVTPGARVPAGDCNAAVSLEKDRAGEIGVMCEWGKDGQGMLDQGRGGLSSHPEFT